VVLVRTRWGGHIGWGTAALPHLRASWAEPLVLDFLALHGHAAKDGGRVRQRAPPHHPHLPLFAAGFDLPRSRL
jgi:hypothetical protein